MPGHVGKKKERHRVHHALGHLLKKSTRGRCLGLPLGICFPWRFDCAELELTDGLEYTQCCQGICCSERVRPLLSWELQSPYVHARRYICCDLTSSSGLDLVLAAHLPVQGD